MESAARKSATPSGAPKAERLFRSYLAVLTSHMAANHLLDPDEAGRHLHHLAREHYEACSFLTDKDWRQISYDRAAAKALGYGLPYADFSERAHAHQLQVVADTYRKASGRT